VYDYANGGGLTLKTVAVLGSTINSPCSRAPQRVFLLPPPPPPLFWIEDWSTVRRSLGAAAAATTPVVGARVLILSAAAPRAFAKEGQHC
jgi:hypothetical protein